MATAAQLPPRTPPRTILNAPQLSPSRMPPPFVLQNSYKSGHRNLDVFSPVDQNGSFCFDREIHRGKVNRRIKNKGAWKPSWRPAYLVLRPNLLSIYQNEDETDLKASITLSEVTAVAPVRKAHTENVFGVFSPSKNYHFQGVSAKDAADWISNIRAETRTEDDGLDMLPPKWSQGHHDPSTYESTDLSADDQPHPPGSPDPPSTAIRARARTGSNLANPQRRASNLQEYSGNEQLTTSHSDFSDVLGSSLPKNATMSLSKPPALTPIASSQQLAPKSDLSPLAQTTITSSAESHQDPERVIRQGHLQILRSHKTGVKGWKWIWVVVRNGGISFYKNEQEYSAVKIFNMNSVITAAEIDPISKSKRYCFQVIMEDKSYRFCAPDEDELAKWLGALKSVLSKRDAAKAKAKGKAKVSPADLLDVTASLSLK
ncbi:uncharacterized protein A1O9_10987 [Exophiala aquamarina CBS 119918]|uniref:PH domain-containing protein n=1 Tax=Exophiala aquamarina CBS 119918 TaxID=1182545 RepID=A0A072NYW9_9EURO|nr:uncharacterized protein A1O9_10987 [Exophiala aquamarina CBS 119918]KEF53079.1 hypothetical protein A1O9_10987 [Exophiala aquamarina CBS 119918]